MQDAKKAKAKRDAKLLAIAGKHLFISSFEAANRDCLDFVEVSRMAIGAALQEAFEAGRSNIVDVSD